MIGTRPCNLSEPPSACLGLPLCQMGQCRSLLGPLLLLCPAHARGTVVNKTDTVSDRGGNYPVNMEMG